MSPAEPSTGTPPTVWTAVAVITCAAAAVTAFWPAMDNGFVYDARPIIVNNPTVAEPGPWYRFWQQKYWPRSGSVDVLYRPLTMASFRLNALVTGGGPGASPFRLVNIAMHALASIGVLCLTWRVLTTDDDQPRNELRPRFDRPAQKRAASPVRPSDAVDSDSFPRRLQYDMAGCTGG